MTAAGAFGIARVELSRRWSLLAIAFVLGLVPLAIGFEGPPDRVQLAEACMFGAVVLSWVAAFVTGITLVGPSLHDGRLAFFFTRPIAGTTIALGKIAGGLALVVAMELAVVVPPAAVLHGLLEAAAPAFALGMGFVFFAVGLVVGILARSRTRWFVVDALGAAVASLLVAAMFERINEIQAWMALVARWTPEQAFPIYERERVLFYGLAAAGALAVIAAVTYAIARGRTHRERVHRELSLVLWTSLSVIAAAGLAVAHWGIL